ncbi:transcription factor E2F6, partial [Brachionus plicatilis]
MSKITPQKRISQFNNKGLSVKKQKLYCVACDQELDHLRKSIIESHLLTPKHIQNSKNVASQKALDFSEENSRDLFLKDLVIGFGSANVPFHKINKKFFRRIFNKYLQPEYKLPSVTSLRRFLPKIYKEELKKIVTFFADSKVALLCDETSDSLNRSVFQIILIKLDLNSDNRPKLVDTLFLEAVNFET